MLRNAGPTEINPTNTPIQDRLESKVSSRSFFHLSGLLNKEVMEESGSAISKDFNPTTSFGGSQ